MFHRLPIRNIEFIKRLAGNTIREMIPRLSHQERLRAAAALYGYASWADLSHAASATTPLFAFDQDLSEDDLDQRRFSQAQAIETVTGLHLPAANWAIQRINATSDFKREAVANSGKLLDEALCNTEDLWWVATNSRCHPLAPVGCHIAVVCHVGDLTRDRQNEVRSVERVRRMIILDCNYDSRGNTTATAHRYFTRAEMLQIASVPTSGAFQGSYRFSPRHDFVGDAGDISDTQKRELWAALTKDYRSLRPQFLGDQVDSDERLSRNLAWHWPLQLIDPERTLPEVFAGMAGATNANNATKEPPPTGQARDVLRVRAIPAPGSPTIH